MRLLLEGTNADGRLLVLPAFLASKIIAYWNPYYFTGAICECVVKAETISRMFVGVACTNHDRWTLLFLIICGSTLFEMVCLRLCQSLGEEGGCVRTDPFRDPQDDLTVNCLLSMERLLDTYIQASTHQVIILG